MKYILFMLLLFFTPAVWGNFDFGTCSGSGSFQQPIDAYHGDYEKTLTVGTIPKGVQNLHIELLSDQDIDIRLYGEDDSKIVHWPKGLLNRATPSTKNYLNTPVTYSGYNGVAGQKGHEFIDVAGYTPSLLTMKVFGYVSGTATVNYSWTGKKSCQENTQGTGYFQQDIVQKESTVVGTIPPNISNISIALTSQEDIDIQLFSEEGTAIISWQPKGLLSGPDVQTLDYKGMHIEWSGYNGTHGKKGHEYIKINKSTETLTMRVYGYASGHADVNYSWGTDNTLAYLPKDINDSVAVNFLSHASFGANTDSTQKLKDLGIVSWIDSQLALPYVPQQHLRRMIVLAKKVLPEEYPQSVENYLLDNDTVFNKSIASFQSKRFQMSAWFESILGDEDQLRHRVAYALSQIIVESLAEKTFLRRTEALAQYFDILTKHAFGNYRDLLLEISHSSSMGVYLTYNGNKKAQLKNGAMIYPDENYARELMQLFSIGLSQLNLDASNKTDAQSNPIPSYTQEDVNEIARVFTGWDLQRNKKYGRLSNKQGDLTHPLEFTDAYHDFGAKELLGKTIEAGNTGSEDIKAVIDILMAHPNIAPFVSKQLIMRLAKSNPSPAYITRIARVFNDNGKGIKGDLKAVTRAIYLDPELWEVHGSKKFKEPLLAYTQFLRAFHAKSLPLWLTSKTAGTEVSNAMWINETSAYLGQGPARAFTVFNFYSNDYIPNDSYFKTTQRVAPELQIQTDSVIIALNNQIHKNLLRLEKRHITHKYGALDDLDAFLNGNFNTVYSTGSNKLLLDCEAEYNVLEKALEGSVDGTFNAFHGIARVNDTSDSQGRTKRDLALQALIVHLDTKLTGGLLSKQSKEILYDYYKNRFYLKNINNAEDPTLKIYEQIIVPLIAVIVTSQSYMVH